MPLGPIGAAATLQGFPVIRDWLFEADRPLEIQDFCAVGVLEHDHAEMIAAWRGLLDGHRGARGLHGPFFGLDIATPDTGVRAVVQKRMMQMLDVAEALGATMMVVHSPFNHWHQLNRANYPGVYPGLIEQAARTLAPVLDRAAGIGCTLVLENCDDTDPAARRAIVQQIDRPNLQISIDTGHADICHGRYHAPNPVDFIADAGALLAHVHLQDVDGYADRHWHPGDGRIAWGPVMQALAALPQAPRLIVEVRNALHRLPATARFLAACADGREPGADMG